MRPILFTAVEPLPTEIKLFPAGTWEHHMFGREKMDATRAQRIIDNFNKGVPRQGVPIIVAHDKNSPAVGWVKELQWRDDGLYATVEWNEEGKQLLQKRQFIFVSPALLTEWKHPVTGEIFKDVLVEVSLTNFPFFGWAQKPLVSLDLTKEHQEPAVLIAYSDVLFTVDYQEEHRWVVQRPRFPVVDGIRWDEDAADQRWRRWVSDRPFDEWDDEEWRKYRQRFILWDAANPREIGSGKLPVCDIVNGRPVVVANAVRNALARLPQVEGVSDDVKERARQVLRALLDEIREEKQGGDAAMEQQKMQDYEALKEEVERLKQEKQQYEERLAQLERERKVREFADTLAELRYDERKVIPPKQRQQWAEILADLPTEMAQKIVELLKAFTLVELGERGYNLRPDDSDKPATNPFEAFTRLIDQTLQQHPDWSYEQAYEFVKRHHRDLAERIAIGR